MKITGLTDEEEAINSIANAFDRVSVMVKSVNSALAQMRDLVGTLHLDAIFNFMNQGMNPLGVGAWNWAGQQVETDKASQMTPYETYVRNQANGVSPGDDGTKNKRDENKTIAEGIDIRNTEIMSAQQYLETVLRQTESTKTLSGTTDSTTQILGRFGDTAAAAIANINSTISAFHASLGQGGGGGGGCRTFGSSSTTSDGHSSSTSYGDGSSRSPGMAWYNVLGNENAGILGVKGANWAASINTSSIIRNSCSGQVCTFEAGGQKFYGDGGGSYSSVNDALIKKDGSVVSFHPDDNILAFKDGSKLQGKNVTINNTFNINGSGDPDKIAEEIMKKIQRIGRIGF